MNPNEQQQQQQQHTTTRRTAIFILFVMTMASRIITSFAFRPSLQSSKSSSTTAALLTRRTMTSTAASSASSASYLSLPDFGSPKFGITKTLTDTSFDEAVDRVQAQLKTAGFGVITKIVRTNETNECHHNHDYNMA
jgi:hypothetical protein